MLVSVDVIGFDSPFTNRVRREIEDRTAIPAAHVILSGTHTHCGPVTFNHFFNQSQPLDEAYLGYLHRQLVQAAVSAATDRRPSVLRSGMVPVSGVARNRRTDDALPVDPQAGVLLAEPLDGSPAVILVNYSCHPTVLGPDTLQISADFPGYAVRHMEAATGARAVFFQGAEGDLSMGHRSDLSAVGVIAPSRTFEKAEELGTRLGRAVVENLATLEPEPARLEVHTSTVELPTKTYAPLPEMVRRREAAAAALTGEASLEAKQRHLYSRIEEYYAGLPTCLMAELTAVRLGNTALLSIPGELFVAIALDIRRQSPFANTLFAGLANGYIGYIPTADATSAAGYEVTAAQVAPAAAAVLTEHCIRLLRSFEP
ncbi:MAG: hypothetical protein NTY38_19300 [Acidobacteria bacterium]|nr:hypothetical protein [Acidobacteriota bacterium]